MLIKRRPIAAAEINDLTKQLASLLNAGMSITNSLNIIAFSAHNQHFRTLVLTIKQCIQNGDTIYASLKKHPQYFNTLYCHIVNAGEQAGQLVKSLQQITNYQTKITSLKQNIKKALIYPACVLSVALIVTTLLLIFVIPKFQQLFESMNAELPLPTQFVIQLANFARYYGWLIIPIIITIIYCYQQCNTLSSTLIRYKERYQLRLPFLGQFFQQFIIARTIRTLATSYNAGLPLIQALKNTANTANNSFYQKAWLQVIKAISNGQTLYRAIQNTQSFPHRVIQLIATGEQSGTLNNMLNQLADYYDQRVATQAEVMSKLAEPVITLLISFMIGGLLIAMYLPIFRLGTLI